VSNPARHEFEHIGDILRRVLEQLVARVEDAANDKPAEMEAPLPEAPAAHTDTERRERIAQAYAAGVEAARQRAERLRFIRRAQRRRRG